MAKKIMTSKDKVPLRVLLGVKNDWTNTFTNEDGSAQVLTGYTFHCQLREKPGGKVLASMTFDLATLATGIVPMSLSVADTEDIGETSGTYDILRKETATPTNIIHVYGGEVEFVPLSTVIA